MTQPSILFQPLRLGDLELPNRVLMAPMTRNRAQPDGTPTELAAEYYRQRASAGLIVTEGVQISPGGKGYIGTPGIHSDAHVAGWRRITDAVHAAGGRIVLQLWHVGRVGHVSLLPDGEVPVAPSALRAQAQVFDATGFVDASEPRALARDELPGLIGDFVAAARRAKEAGFDGVEVHGANGYLLDQFLRDGTNRRTDDYGGSAENRARLLVEVTEAVAEVWGAGRVGVRLSPFATVNDMADSDPETTFAAAYRALDRLGLAYLHVVEKFPGSELTAAETAALDRLRRLWSGAYIVNGDFDADRAAERIAGDHAAAVTFGRPFIANPDLPERYRTGAALNEADQSSIYGGDARGYTDYPALDAAA